MRVVIVASVITLLPLILTVSLPRPMRDFPGLPRLQRRPRDNPGDPGIAGCNQRGVRPVRPAGCGGPHQMNPKSRRPAVASPSSAHTDRSDRDPGRRDPAGVVSSDTQRADQQIPCTGRGNARPQPLSGWPNTTTVRTVPARNWTFSRPPRRRMDQSGADERVPDQSAIPKTSSDDDDDTERQCVRLLLRTGAGPNGARMLSIARCGAVAMFVNARPGAVAMSLNARRGAPAMFWYAQSRRPDDVLVRAPRRPDDVLVRAPRRSHDVFCRLSGHSGDVAQDGRSASDVHPLS